MKITVRESFAFRTIIRFEALLEADGHPDRAAVVTIIPDKLVARLLDRALRSKAKKTISAGGAVSLAVVPENAEVVKRVRVAARIGHSTGNQQER